MRLRFSRLVAVWPFSMRDSIARLISVRCDTSAIVRPMARRSVRMVLPM